MVMLPPLALLPADKLPNADVQPNSHYLGEFEGFRRGLRSSELWAFPTD